MAIAGTLGTISFIEGRPLITGGASGLNTAALVEAELQARRLPAVKLENRITENDTQIAAFTDLQALLQTLGDSLNGLRNPPGFSNLNDDIFELNAAFLSSSSTTPATNLLGATVDSTAADGIIDLEILQIATAHKVSSDPIVDVTAALGVTETLTIGLVGAPVEEQFNLSIDATTTTADIVAAVNSQSGTTGVRASLIKVSDTDSRLVFTATDTNRNIELVGTTGATTAALGVSADNGVTYTNVLKAAQPAQLLVNGITDPIFRDTNEIDDIFQGVTLDLLLAEPGTTITLEIEPDLSAVRQTITDFVESYNAVRAFLIEQQKISGEGEVSETAILFGSNTVRTLSSDLGNDVASIVPGLGATALSNFRDLGIEFDSENFLTLDTGKLDSALVDDIDQIRDLLGFGFAADSPRVNIVARENLVEVGTFTIDFPAGAIDGTNVQVAGVDAFEIDGSVVRGLAGTIYDGLVLGYARDTSDAGEAAESITFTTTTGLAERLFQTVENFINPTDGLITGEITRFQEQNVDFLAEIRAIDARIALIQASLLVKFAALEQAILQADAISSQLRAFLDASTNN